MESVKNIIAKLIVGKQISEQDIKRLILGKNVGIVNKITKHLDQTVNVAKAIKNNPKILEEVLKNKLVNETFKYAKNNKKNIKNER